MNSVAIPASAPSTTLSAEGELVRSAARGDAEAFDELFRRHSEPSWRLAQAVAPDRDAAVSAFRDGFVRALRASRAPRRPSSYPAAFRPEVLAAVYKAAVDQAYDRSAPPASRRAHPEVTLALADAAFRSLPERWRAAVWLSEVESMDVDRIAPVLGVSAAVATQLVTRGRRGLAGRFAQAGHEVPEHLGETLRAVAMATPAKLMEETQTRFAAAGSERGPILAPVATWLEDRAVRPMSVAVGALVGLGLIGLGVVPQGAAVRSQLGAGGVGSLAGAVPVQTCLGLPCSASGGGQAGRSALGAPGSATVDGLLGGSGGFSLDSSTAGGGDGLSGYTPADGSTVAGGGSSTGSTAGGGTSTGGGTSGPAPAPAPAPAPSPSPAPSPTPTTIVSLGPVANVTSSGSALNVNLLPTSSGSTATVTAGGSGLIGVSTPSTTVAPASTTQPTLAPTNTSSSSPTTSTTVAPLAPITSTVTNTLGTLTSGL